MRLFLLSKGKCSSQIEEELIERQTIAKSAAVYSIELKLAEKLCKLSCYAVHWLLDITKDLNWEYSIVEYHEIAVVYRLIWKQVHCEPNCRGRGSRTTAGLWILFPAGCLPPWLAGGKSVRLGCSGMNG